MFGGLVAFFIAAYFLSKYLHKIPVANKLVLSTATAPQPIDTQKLIEPEESFIRSGHTGATVSQLRPSGYARINQRRVDVVTRGELVEANRQVEVIEVEGNRIIVKEIEKPS